MREERNSVGMCVRSSVLMPVCGCVMDCVSACVCVCVCVCVIVRTQAVYSGPVSDAEQHLAALGAPLPSPGVAVPDHMLDLVIRSDRDTVLHLVEAYRASRYVRAIAQFAYMPCRGRTFGDALCTGTCAGCVCVCVCV